MTETPEVIRHITLELTDYDAIDCNQSEHYKIEMLEYGDGAVRCKLNDKTVYLNVEMLANWAYTLNNWRNRIERDIIKNHLVEE